MTRVQWLFVLALVVIVSHGLVQAQELPSEQQLATAQALTQEAEAALTATPKPTFTPLPTDEPTPTSEPSATATPEPTLAPTETPTPWPTPGNIGTHPEEERFIFIDQYNQRLYVYERGVLVRNIACSTGLPESDKYTPAASGRVGQYWGTFTSFGVDVDNAWYLYKSSGSILIHSIPYLLDEQGNKVYQDRDALGVRPSSHGCIRISPEDAAWLTVWNPEGALFEVTEPYLDKWLATD